MAIEASRKTRVARALSQQVWDTLSPAQKAEVLRAAIIMIVRDDPDEVACQNCGRTDDNYGPLCADCAADLG